MMERLTASAGGAGGLWDIRGTRKTPLPAVRLCGTSHRSHALRGYGGMSEGNVGFGVYFLAKLQAIFTAKGVHRSA